MIFTPKQKKEIALSLSEVLSDTDKNPNFITGSNSIWLKIGEYDRLVSVKLEISEEDNTSKEQSLDN